MEEVVASFVGMVPNLRLIKEPRQGLSFARNAGMAAAQGAWVASLDSDAKADGDWVMVIVREVTSDNFDCFGGPYRAWHKYGPSPAWFALEWETSMADFAQYGPLAQGQYPTGGSCAFPKSLAQQLGGSPLI